MVSKCLSCVILELGFRIKPKRYMRTPALDHGTVQSCNYCTTPIAKLQSSRTVQVAFAWCFVYNNVSQRCTFWSARECRHIIPHYICEWTICAVKAVRECMRNRQSWNEGIWNATQLCQAFGGLAVRTLPGASRLFNPTLRACPRQTDVLLACIDSFFSLFPRFACEGVWSGIFFFPHGSIFRCASVSQALIYLW